MNTFYHLVDQANKYFETADHLAFVTYPALKDNKLFISVIENLHKSVKYAIEAVIHYEKLFKRIPVTPDDFTIKLDIFKRICVPRYNIPRESVLLVEDLQNFVKAHKKSTMEFSRRNNFVLASKDFRLKTINLYKIKGYISQAKSLIDKVNTIASKNDRVFRR